MKYLWYKDHYRTNGGKLFDKVNSELEKHVGSRYEHESIELFGNIDGEFELVDYRSRDIILARYDGVVYSTDEEIDKYYEMMGV